MMYLDILPVALVFVLLCSAIFVTGWTDVPLAIATLVTTNGMRYRRALLLAVLSNVGGVLTVAAIHTTVGEGIVDPTQITLGAIAGACFALIVWCSLAGLFGIPSSKSQALISGLAGGGFASGGADSVIFDGWLRVLAGIVIAIVASGILAYGIGRLLFRVASSMSYLRGKRFFDQLQAVGAILVAYNHGLREGQLFVDFFALTLLLSGLTSAFAMPWWLIGVCAFFMGLGTAIGGKRILYVLGEKIARIDPWQGGAAGVSATLTTFTATLSGVPLSTVHASVAAITGAGASRSKRHVRWRYPLGIFLATLVTFPMCAVIAYFGALLFEKVFT
jgi:PiT family inorganic phosphate transporter